MNEFDFSQHPAGLAVYATTHGHTGRIAARIAAAMHEAGVEVDLRDVATATAAEPRRYDVIVVGASLHRGRRQQELVDWVESRRRALRARPAAFFSVSLSAADDSAQSRADAQRCIDEFCAHSGWTPQRTAPIAGCLEYREYDVFTRQLMRRSDHPTDPSKDYDYTDWDAVDRLGREFAAMARPRVAA
jgi:menaquinone-dependent protoporphyrinogen oxidase